MRQFGGLVAVVWLVAMIGIVGTLRASKGPTWVTYVPPAEGHLLIYIRTPFYNPDLPNGSVMEFDLERRTLTHLFSAVGAHSFTYAADRTQIAYIQSTADGEYINAFDLTTCESTTLLESDAGQVFAQLDGSPDGQSISFATYSNDQQGAYTLDVATGEPTRVAASRLGAIWTHDSQPVTLVNGTTVSIKESLHDLSFDGVSFSEATTDANTRRPYIVEMTLSPDGAWLAYETRLRLPGGITIGDLLVSDLSVEGSTAVYSRQTKMSFAWSDDNQLVYYDADVGLVGYDPATHETHTVKLCLRGWADSHNVTLNWSHQPPGAPSCQTIDYDHLEMPTDVHPCAQTEAN